MQGEQPRYLKVEAGLLLVWAAVQLISFAAIIRPADFDLWRLGVLTEIVVTGVAGWMLWRGKAWGYILGVASGIYWLWLAARVLLLSGTAALFYLVLGCVVLAGLLMPRSVRWFRSVWRARSRPIAIG